MLNCRARNASAKPPARLGALLPPSGVARPLPSLVPILTALSRGAGGGAGFLVPAPGRFGGAGGVGLALAAGEPLMPFVFDAAAGGGGGGGTTRLTGAGGGGGGISAGGEASVR